MKPVADKYRIRKILQDRFRIRGRQVRSSAFDLLFGDSPSYFPPTLLSGLHRNNCVSWVHYLTRGLIDEGVIPEPDWKTFPKYMTGIANEDFSTNPARYKSLYGAIRNKEQKNV